MSESITPKYSSESFIPFALAGSSQINSKVKNDCPGSSRNYASHSHKRNQTSSTTDSFYVPWKRTAYSCGVIGLHEEINDFYEKMHPTDEETEIRLRVVEHITKIVHSLWPHAKVEVFGSFRTGLYLPSSDIDLVVNGEWRMLPLSTLSQALQQNGISKDDISVIANATVPIIRMVHTPTKVKVDICFNMTNGINSAKLVKKLMKTYPALPKLVLVLKQFLVHRGLNEVYHGGMSSYCLTLLIVSLLQGIHKPKAVPSSNLGTLLLEFFEHYGVNFNYERVSIHVQSGESGGMYQPKYLSENMLCVEDPLVSGHDVAKGTYLMYALKQAFENAFFVLHKAVTDSAAGQRSLNSYLSLILSVDEKIWQERQFMLENYSSILRKLSELSPANKESQNIFNAGDKRNAKRKNSSWSPTAFRDGESSSSAAARPAKKRAKPTSRVEDINQLSEQLISCLDEAYKVVPVLKRAELAMFFSHVKKKGNALRIAMNFTQDTKMLKKQLQAILDQYYSTPQTGAVKDIQFIKWLRGLVDRFDGVIPRKRTSTKKKQ